MYNTTGLIPARFLTLITHFIICVILLWSSKETVKTCLTEMYSKEVFRTHQTQLIVGLSVAVGMICFEMLAFLTGLTMFHSTSALLSIGCHASASILLCYLIFDNWQCGWYWWIFAFCSILPEVPHNVKKGWTRLLILAGIATTFGSSLPVGYNIGVINTPAEIIKTFCNDSMYTRYGVVLGKGQLDFLWSAIVAVFLVGGTVGSLSGSWLADTIGRKGALLTSGLLSSTAGVLFLFSKACNSVEMLIAGRLLVGLSAGLITCAMPMYLTELAPLRLRGSMGVLCPLGVTFGVLVAQIMGLQQLLGTTEFWPHLLAFFLVPMIVSATAIPFLTESPKYLFVVKKQQQLALRQLARIRQMDEEFLNDEIRELQLEQHEDEQRGAESWNLGKLLSDGTLFLPLLLVCSLQAGQQFSGINAVFFYSQSIFKLAGLSEQSNQLATIGAGIINLGMAIISIPVMSHFNRRITLQLSISTSIFFLMVLGVSITYIEVVHWMPYLSIIGVLGFVLCYGIGLGPIPYFIGSELFEIGPRSSAMALGSMANWGGNFIIGISFPTMQSCIGAGSFFVFAAITMCLFIFVRMYLPETRGRDPSEVALLCRLGFSSKPLASPVSSTSTVETFPITDEKSA